MNFKVLEESDERLKVQFAATGLRALFLVMGVGLATGIGLILTNRATHSTTLECQRDAEGGGACQVVERSLLGESTTEIPLGAIRAVTVDQDGSALQLAQRSESTTVPLPSESDELVARVRGVAVDGDRQSVKIHHDPEYRPTFAEGFMVVLVVGLLVFPIVGRMRSTVCLSRPDNSLTIRHVSFWSSNTVERTLDEIADIVVVEKNGSDRMGGNARTVESAAENMGRRTAAAVDKYRLEALMESGDYVPLSNMWDRPRERLSEWRDQLFVFVAGSR